MLTVNTDIEDHFINGQIGNRISKIFVKLDNANLGRKRKMSSAITQEYELLGV